MTSNSWRGVKVKRDSRGKSGNLILALIRCTHLLFFLNLMCAQANACTYTQT